MSRKFQCKSIPSTWLENNGRRLDCGPYLAGSLEARELLRKHITEPLKAITSDIFHAGREGRLWVDSLEFGVPFMGSTDMLAADLSNLPLISKKQIEANPKFSIGKGWTLITRSGTVGRMAYARNDMDGVACSEHVMRVVPETGRIKSGYLYAYLSSRFGVPIVVSGTYGAIIQHIEPHHIAGLPVPRLGEVEDLAHELVQQAADLRSEANKLIDTQVKELEEEIAGGNFLWEHTKPQSFSVEAKSITSRTNRLDAFYHIGFVGEAEKKAHVPLIEIGSVADSLRPPIFKRIHVQEGGYEFLGGADVMTMRQQSDDRISAKTKHIDKFIVKPGQVLFQCVGQRYGIFGRPTLANRVLIGKAVSEHQIRITPHDIRDAGYICIYLATGFGLRFLLMHSSGTSIPVLQEEGAKRIKIYWPDPAKRHAISVIAEKAWDNRARAVELEDEARTLVERAIEEGGR